MRQGLQNVYPHQRQFLTAVLLAETPGRTAMERVHEIVCGLAMDGVERFCVPCFQQLADSTKYRKDTEDRKDSFCVRFVCEFLE